MQAQELRAQGDTAGMNELLAQILGNELEGRIQRDPRAIGNADHPLEVRHDTRRVDEGLGADGGEERTPRCAELGVVLAEHGLGEVDQLFGVRNPDRAGALSPGQGGEIVLGSARRAARTEQQRV